MSVMANGCGSREKTRLALKRQHTTKKDEIIVAQSTAVQSEDELADAKSVSLSSDIKQFSGPNRSNVRLVKSFMGFPSSFFSLFQFLFLWAGAFCFPT